MKKLFKTIKEIFPTWLMTFFLTTAIFFTIYASMQQVLRQTTYDPQIELAQDLANNLNNGVKLPTFKGYLDMDKTLATFLIVYNFQGKPLAANVRLDSKIPSPPYGVFQNAENSKENRLTWQPKPGVRIASIVKPFGKKTGYILVGRSLKETENRIERIGFLIFLAWAVTSIAGFFLLTLWHIP